MSLKMKMCRSYRKLKKSKLPNPQILFCRCVLSGSKYRSLLGRNAPLPYHATTLLGWLVPAVYDRRGEIDFLQQHSLLFAPQRRTYHFQQGMADWDNFIFRSRIWGSRASRFSLCHV